MYLVLTMTFYQKQMHITEITVYQSPIRLKKAFVISLGRYDHANNILVKIRADNGLVGFGECNPFMTITGETMESAFEVAKHLAPYLIGRNPVDIQDCIETMDRLIYGNTSIKSAFDIAIHDLASQAAGLPLYKYLGGTQDKQIYTDYTVSIGEPEQMANDAVEIVENGFRIVKVKLGNIGKHDVERIKTIRAAIGTNIAIRVDANQGWTVDEAIETLNKLYHSDIQYCEEPVPRWKFTELSKIRANSPVPLMADESCIDHHDAKRLIDMQACDMFNLKTGKSSGLFKAMKIIRLAEEHNIPMQIGGFLESRVAFTACAHLAFASKLIKYFDFDTPLMAAFDPVEGGLTYHENGQVKISDRPGLGLSIPESYLKELKSFSVY